MADTGPGARWGARTLRALVALLARIPPSILRSLGRTVGLASDFLGARRARTTDVNLALAFPDLPLRSRRALARRSLVADAQLALELPATWSADPGRLLSRVEGRAAAARLAAAEQAGRGVLLLVPHLGNWELLCLWLQARSAPDRPFTALFRPLRDAAANRWLQARRERSGARLVPTDAAGLRALLRALRGGGLVGILPDQVPGPDAGVLAPFHGRDARTMTLVRGLLRRSGAEVLVATALPEAAGHRIHLLDVEDDLADEDPRTAAGALNRALEACIALAPEEYQWGYKRYRHAAPDGRDYYAVPRK